MTTPLQFRPGPPALNLPQPQRIFERKVVLSKLALMLEAAWPLIWVLAGLALMFVGVSLIGVWAMLPEWAHKSVLGAFALAGLVTLAGMVRIRVPSREAAIRRIEQRSGVPHRPASAYEDTVSAGSDDAIAQRIWAAHKSRLAAAIAKLRVGAPSPRTDRYDPFALRALMLLGVVTLTLLAGDAAGDRLAAAFRFGPLAKSTSARLDAWVTPPAYTNAAPVMLADGARGLAGLKLQGDTAPTVPANSTLIVRSSGGIAALSLELTTDAAADGAKPDVQRIEPPKPGKGDEAATSDTTELKAELKRNGSVRVLSEGRELVRWAFNVTPDLPPKVSFTRQPERTLHGALRIPYHVEDDYGVASLEAHISRLPEKADTSANAWARLPKVKGPRPPFEQPPRIVIRLPQTYPKSADGVSLHELGDSVWAGLPVTLTLIAKDSANQTGTSDARKMVLPSRQFFKPLALAVVEQRRDLVNDPRQLRHILDSLDAITLKPETAITDLSVYLELRSVYWRLKNNHTRATRSSAVDQLWRIALRIEDGALSDAERALKDAQDKLSKALENGASDEEIRQLMQDLRQAMANFIQELAKQAQNRGQEQQGADPNQMLSQNDLESMLQNLENMARSGNRDQAQQMLSELRDLMDRLQSGRMANQQGQGNGEANKLMNQLGELLGKEQGLLDDTFRQQQGADDQPGQDGQQGQMGQPGRPGQQGRPGRQGRQGQRGQQGQQGQNGQNGQNGQGNDPGQGTGQGLGNRQQALRDLLDQLQQGLTKNGLDVPGQFGDAGKAMREAEDALRKGDLGQGSEGEQQALDALRKGARQLAEEMMKKGGRQMGQSGPPTSPLDPLGRPRPTTDGSDPGRGVKVPDQIDVQRAREILEELRRRLGETTRPTFELDYLERLLQQF